MKAALPFCAGRGIKDYMHLRDDRVLQRHPIKSLVETPF